MRFLFIISAFFFTLMFNVEFLLLGRDVPTLIAFMFTSLIALTLATGFK